MEDYDVKALRWCKSSGSEESNCVEVAITPDRVYIRHSQDRAGKILSFTYGEWQAFTAGVRNNEFNLDISPRNDS